MNRELTNITDVNLHHGAVGFALEIGEQLRRAGGEIGRVEDTVNRICRAFGAVRVDVFGITSCLIVTAIWEDGAVVTQSRRMGRVDKNMVRLERINALSRRVCAQGLALPDAQSELKAILQSQKSSLLRGLIGSLLVGLFYTAFFGGDVWDCLAALPVAAVIFGVRLLCVQINGNRFLAEMMCAFFATATAFVCIACGMGHSTENVMIGCIMLLIPGVAMTGAVENMLVGDTISGMIDIFESLTVALALAGGYALAATLLGGLAI